LKLIETLLKLPGEFKGPIKIIFTIFILDKSDIAKETNFIEGIIVTDKEAYLSFGQ